MKKDIEFEVDEKKYTIKVPSYKVRQESRKYYRQTFTDSIRNGAFLRSSLSRVAREAGIITEEEEGKIQSYYDEIESKERILNSGGIELKVGRKTAIDLIKLRENLLNYYADINSLDSCTAEHEAEVSQDLYIISQCLYVGKNKYQPNYDKFIEVDEDPVIIAAIFHYTIDKRDLDKIDKSPENTFLQEYGFVDPSGNFIDEKGRYVDIEGKCIESKNGKAKVEFSPFLKNGKPVKV